MSGSNSGNDKVTTIAVTLLIVGLLFLYLKKSGQLGEIQNALSFLGGG